MSDLTHTIDTYLSAWSEQDPDARAALVSSVWSDDGRLVDPPMAASGHDEISGMHAALQGQFAGHTFRRASAIDAHHDIVRFAWELVGPDGTVAMKGLDVGEIGEDGRLRRVNGFFGELEAA
jgi:SnoaL-like domain